MIKSGNLFISFHVSICFNLSMFVKFLTVIGWVLHSFVVMFLYSFLNHIYSLDTDVFIIVIVFNVSFIAVLICFLWFPYTIQHFQVVKFVVLLVSLLLRSRVVDWCVIIRLKYVVFMHFLTNLPYLYFIACILRYCSSYCVTY